jgi:L,D-transpeptidase catalytic domain
MQVRWRGMWRAAVVAGLCATTPAWAVVAPNADQLVIHVWKTRHELWLQQGNHVIKKFHVALGKDPAASKLSRGDRLTPAGHYYVCEKHAQSAYHRFLGLSYPNAEDAERAYSRHLITADQWADIFFANLQQATPPWATPLGGAVGIHGYGDRPFIAVDWTDGCIAVSNEDIDYLYDHVPVGTPVIISSGDPPPSADDQPGRQASTSRPGALASGANAGAASIHPQ